MENKSIHLETELKALEEEGMFEGYASTFGNTDVVDDIVMNGAFADSLKKREPKVLWQHDMKQPVGKLMEAREDENGLYVKVKLATKTTLGKDAYELVKAGIIDKLSIGFTIAEAEYDRENGTRKIIKAELFEFSLVTIPANDQAAITAVKEGVMTERQFEKFLTDNNFDRSAAKSIVAKGYKGYLTDLRDAGVDTPNDDLRDADEVVKTLSKLLQTLKGENNDRQKSDRDC
jgi:HK97 family phage prohead protease